MAMTTPSISISKSEIGCSSWNWSRRLTTIPRGPRVCCAPAMVVAMSSRATLMNRHSSASPTGLNLRCSHGRRICGLVKHRVAIIWYVALQAQIALKRLATCGTVDRPNHRNLIMDEAFPQRKRCPKAPFPNPLLTTAWTSGRACP
jgi:hypothetical protein